MEQPDGICPVSAHRHSLYDSAYRYLCRFFYEQSGSGETLRMVPEHTTRPNGEPANNRQ